MVHAPPYVFMQVSIYLLVRYLIDDTLSVSLTMPTFPILSRNSVDTSCDVQTDVHLVPVDTDRDTHKLLVLLMS